MFVVLLCMTLFCMFFSVTECVGTLVHKQSLQMQYNNDFKSFIKKKNIGQNFYNNTTTLFVMECFKYLHTIFNKTVVVGNLSGTYKHLDILRICVNNAHWLKYRHGNRLKVWQLNGCHKFWVPWRNVNIWTVDFENRESPLKLLLDT